MNELFVKPTIFLLPLWGVLLFLGITAQGVAAPSPESDALRYDAVADQIDPGGVLYGYVSVEGDLTRMVEYLDSFMIDQRKLDESVPEFDLKALLEISGFDSISALGMSSIRFEGGFRNKVYLHCPEGRKGFLSLFGSESQPFDVLKLAPSGSDFVMQQDINLKTFYDDVLMQALSGDPLTGKSPLGPQGMMLRMIAEGFMKQPLHPELSLTVEKLLADMDTTLTFIVDANPQAMMILPDTNGLQIPKLHGIAMLDGIGWVVDEWVKVAESNSSQNKDFSHQHVKIIANRNLRGFQLDLSSFSKKEKKELQELGWETAILAHHIPSGKLIASSSKKFVSQVFNAKAKLAKDPVFKKTMQGLPLKGTAMSYLSPVFQVELRKVVKAAIDLQKSEKGNLEVAMSMLDIFLPEGAQGEGVATMHTEEGLLTVSNSMFSNKSKILLSAAAPLLVGVSTFTLMKPVTRMVKRIERPLPERKNDEGLESNKRTPFPEIEGRQFNDERKKPGK
jgi:hypothetical protein